MLILMTRSSTTRPNPQSERRRKLAIAGAGLLVLLTASFFRLWLIDQVPPGLAGDEADFGNAALRILSGEYFIVSDVGQLISYVQVPFILLLGRTPLALHLPGALSGSLAAVFVFLFVLEAFRKPWAAFVSGLVFAITLATVHLTRLAFPTVHLFLLQAATYYFFWRGLRRGQRWSFVLGGLSLGLALHAYQSALALPLAMGLTWLGWLAMILRASAAERKPSLRALAVYALCFWGAFLLPALPVLANALTSSVYTGSARYSGQFIFNAAVNGGAPWQVLLDQVRYHLLMYGVLGDPIWRHNLPGRPLFDLPLALLFWLGVLVSLRQVRRAPHAFLALQAAVTLLPGLLARVDGGAHFLHASAVFVPSVVYPGLAADWLITTLRTRRPWAGTAGAILVILLLAWAGANTLRDYFGAWRAGVQGTLSFDELFVDAAAVLNQRAGDVDAWIVPTAGATPQGLSSSAMRFLYTGSAPLRFVPANDQTAPQDLAQHLAGAQRVGLVTWDPAALLWAEPVYADAKGLLPFLLARAGQVVDRQAYDGFSVDIYELAAGPAFDALHEQMQPSDATFGDGSLTLSGYAYDGMGGSAATAGEPLALALQWQASQAPGRDLKAAVLLMDRAGHVILQDDQFLRDAAGVTSAAWSSDANGLDVRLLELPAGTSPGAYQVQVAVYDAATLERLPVASGDKAAARVAIAGPLTLGSPTLSQQAVPAPQQPLTVTIGAPPGLLLAGYDALPQEAKPGDTLTLTSYWQALQDAPAAPTIQLELIDQASGALAQSQAIALRSDYPPTRWTAGQYVADRSDVRLNRDLPSGVYAVQLAIDEGVSVRRSRLLNPPVQRVELGDVAVVGWPRQFEPPAVAQPAAVRFGDQMQLTGYTVGPAVAGQPLLVTLCWQALAEMDTSYVTFVHLLDAEGRLVSQNDAIPGQGAYPTTGWLPGEFICSDHVLPLDAGLPAGTYMVSAGVYNPLFEQRLPAAMDGELAGDEVPLTAVEINP